MPGTLNPGEARKMKRLVLGLGLLLAATPRAGAEQASLSSHYNELLRLDRRRPGPGANLSWGQEYQKLRGGAVKRAGRLSLQSPYARAEVVYVPKSGDPGNYRLIAELGVEAPIIRNSLGFKVSWTDKYDSRPGRFDVGDETQWLASLSLRFGR